MNRIAAIAVLALLFPIATVGAQTITEFHLSARPGGITAGPDGNLWFTEPGANRIGRISTAGVVTEFPVTAFSGPENIVAGPDGNLWFTQSARRIGRITTQGVVTGDFVIQGFFGGHGIGIAAGSDGNLWFTEQISEIGRITTSGSINQYTIAYDHPFGITAGPDGNIWFTVMGGAHESKICRVTPGGMISEYSGSWLWDPSGITAGPDGNIWYTEGISVGRISPAGVFTEFSLPSAERAISSIAAGPDGNLWVTDGPGDRIFRINTAGVVTGEFHLPMPGSYPLSITAGRDGNMWFTERSGKIGRISTREEIPTRRRAVVRR